MSFYLVIKKQIVEDLELKEGSEFQGKLSRVSVRGTLTHAHDEITHAQIEALNSTF